MRRTSHGFAALRIHKNKIGFAFIQQHITSVSLILKAYTRCGHFCNGASNSDFIIVMRRGEIAHTKINYGKKDSFIFKRFVCNAARTKCFNACNFEVSCIISVINISHAVGFCITHTERNRMCNHAAKGRTCLTYAPALFSCFLRMLTKQVKVRGLSLLV